MDFFDKKVFNKRFYALSDSSSFAFSDSKPSLSSHMGPQLESVPMKTVDDVPNNDDDDDGDDDHDDDDDDDDHDGDDDDDDDDDALLRPFHLVHILFVWQSSLLKSLPCFQIIYIKSARRANNV